MGVTYHSAARLLSRQMPHLRSDSFNPTENVSRKRTFVECYAIFAKHNSSTNSEVSKLGKFALHRSYSHHTIHIFVSKLLQIYIIYMKWQREDWKLSIVPLYRKYTTDLIPSILVVRRLSVIFVVFFLHFYRILGARNTLKRKSWLSSLIYRRMPTALINVCTEAYYKVLENTYD